MHPKRVTQHTAPSPSHALDERDAGRYIGYKPDTLRKWRREGTGPAYIRCNRSVRYLLADLDAWLAKHRVETREMAS